MTKENYSLILLVLLLTACGGGSGGGTPPTELKGNVTPLLSPAAAPPIQSVAPVPPTNMLLPPNSLPADFPAITQSMDYTFDPAAVPLMKVTSLSINHVDSDTSAIGLSTSATAFLSDPTLGQPNGINVLVPGGGVGIGAGTFTLTNNTLGNLPAAVLTVNLPGGTGSELAGYVLPYSATLNPAGYTYQTFGSWLAILGGGITNEGYFSTGIPTTAATLPIAGTATYTGQTAGSLVDVTTRDPSDTAATMNATVDFGARTVAFSTISTTSLSNNAASGVLPSANSGLDMSGTLSYAAGSNTFTGAVTTTNGMSGNVTCRFYGAGIAAMTATKVLGAPPEIGCTFAVMSTSVGAMQGASGGN